MVGISWWRMSCIPSIVHHFKINTLPAQCLGIDGNKFFNKWLRSRHSDAHGNPWRCEQLSDRDNVRQRAELLDVPVAPWLMYKRCSCSAYLRPGEGEARNSRSGRRRCELHVKRSPAIVLWTYLEVWQHGRLQCPRAQIRYGSVRRGLQSIVRRRHPFANEGHTLSGSVPKNMNIHELEKPTGIWNDICLWTRRMSVSSMDLSLGPKHKRRYGVIKSERWILRRLF